jgi:L-rhamnose mutarotase
MGRVRFKGRVRPGREDEYDRHHAQMWPDSSQLVAESGPRNATIVRRGTPVVGYAECHPDAANAHAGDRTELCACWAWSTTDVLEDGEPDGVPEVRHQD